MSVRLASDRLLTASIVYGHTITGPDKRSVSVAVRARSIGHHRHALGRQFEPLNRGPIDKDQR